MNYLLFSTLLLTLIVLSPTLARAAEEIPIWPGKAPGTENRPNEEVFINERIQKVYQPSLTIYRPSQELTNGTAVLVCPGGGFHHVTIQKEGHDIAKWLNTLGITAFVLKYRLDKPEPFQDADRAMRLIRSRASEWNIDPNKIGAIGFSAGGLIIVHMTLNADSGNPASPDPIEQTPNRPDFLIPVYTALGSHDLEKSITAKTPPMFLPCASNDKTPAQNAIRLYQALIKAGVPAELHLYERGGHGFGLGKNAGSVDMWTKQCVAWMRMHEWIK